MYREEDIYWILA